MSIIEIFLIAVALSMDAFAVALCKGLSMQKIHYARCFIISLFFGGFQAIMTLIGWLLSSYFHKYISFIDHYIVFILLSAIGIKMIYDSFQSCANVLERKDSFSIKEIFFLAIATSIDALAVGITFALLPEKSIMFPVILIGLVTFCLSFIGVIIGNKCGNRYEQKAEFAGGFILLCIAFKVLFEHLYLI